MRQFLLYSLLIVHLFTPCARADFVVAPSPPAAPAEASATSAPSPATNKAASDLVPRKPLPLAEPRFAIAQGFGEHVPLRFAVRQMVPQAVKVTYGPGADPDALVDWNGGAGWNRVLANAVRPLGLRLVMTYMAVEIRK